MIKEYLLRFIKFISIIFLFFIALNVKAKRPEYHLAIKNNLFYPAEISIPANKKVKLVIYNHDDNVEEFDSFDLNREKVIFPGQQVTIFIGPLSSGEYNFFGEYNPQSARGKIIVVNQVKNKEQIKGERNVN